MIHDHFNPMSSELRVPVSKGGLEVVRRLLRKPTRYLSCVCCELASRIGVSIQEEASNLVRAIGADPLDNFFWGLRISRNANIAFDSSAAAMLLQHASEVVRKHAQHPSFDPDTAN
ncbi:hypothetical protein BST61_g1853 [Cercospora zeina]